jgi:hypothetical protein
LIPVPSKQRWGLVATRGGPESILLGEKGDA